MIVEPIFFYILIGSVFFLSTLLVILVWWQISLIHALLENKQKSRQSEIDLVQKETEMIKKGKDEAEKIVRQAIRRAIVIEKEAEINQGELKKILEKRLEIVSRALLKDYQTSLSQSLKKVINNVNNISKDIEKETKLRIEAEIGNYKKTRLEKIDEQIYNLVDEAAQEVLGKSLSLEDQEELVFRAIEKAKKRLWQTQ